MGGDAAGDLLQFIPSTATGALIIFVDKNDASTSGGSGVGTVSAVPEPTSLVLLAGVIGWVVFDLKRRVGKKSAIH